MGKEITLTAEDGHSFKAWRVDAQNEAKTGGGIVVLPEIFGVNDHIKDVCERFADEGFDCIAPSLYDRSSQKGCSLGYDAQSIAIGRKLRDEFSWQDSALDVAAAVRAFDDRGLNAGCVGYCWGGTIAFLAATRLDGLAAAVVYYGGQIIPFKDESARCPMLMHFGERDQGIPLADVEAIRQAQPRASVHLYDADHGFNCDRRQSHEPESAALAFRRTIDFFSDQLGRAAPAS
ncbi:MAG: dienelactone hydrolase family protein [Ectothiorhodospiraceae bacterium AqS1]|nr:dienelactone hydrolase family protein [Ectothiorhodospiraceae bacterium AqS1]